MKTHTLILLSALLAVAACSGPELGELPDDPDSTSPDDATTAAIDAAPTPRPDAGPCSTFGLWILSPWTCESGCEQPDPDYVAAGRFRVTAEMFSASAGATTWVGTRLTCFDGTMAIAAPISTVHDWAWQLQPDGTLRGCAIGQTATGGPVQRLCWTATRSALSMGVEHGG